MIVNIIIFLAGFVIGGYVLFRVIIKYFGGRFLRISPDRKITILSEDDLKLINQASKGGVYGKS